MLTLDIHNLGTGTEENSEYEYWVYINNKLIFYGTISGHNRTDGWPMLLKLIAEDNIDLKEEL